MLETTERPFMILVLSIKKHDAVEMLLPTIQIVQLPQHLAFQYTILNFIFEIWDVP